MVLFLKYWFVTIVYLLKFFVLFSLELYIDLVENFIKKVLSIIITSLTSRQTRY